MNYLVEAFAWLADPSRWPGPNGIGLRLGEHIASMRARMQDYLGGNADGGAF